jgi:hypothetical protein
MKKVTKSILIDEELCKVVSKLAVDNQRSFNAQVIYMIKQQINKGK